MTDICSKEMCTGCGACIDICPRQCITFSLDALGNLYPNIDNNLCVDCGLCVRTCPNNTAPQFNTPTKVLAAWSTNPNVRKSSASGGIATELYKRILEKKGIGVGVTYDMHKGAIFVPVTTSEDVSLVSNSKYTFSVTKGIFRYVRDCLNKGKEVLFVGLPCQVAGLLNFLKKPHKLLTTVDIICHGVAPTSYIKQHIEYIEQKKHDKTTKIFFRDPAKGTHLFYLSLYNAKKCFYSKKAQAPDVYQLGYHKALIYRPNCYNCIYAQHNRVSDLTIGDFSGVGRNAPWTEGSINVSCILVNTAHGEEFISHMPEQIICYERPQTEAFNYEKQLQHPSIPHHNRVVFENRYKECGNFEVAATDALRVDLKKAKKAQLSPKPYIKKLVVKLTTPTLRKKLKQIASSISNGK